MKKFFIIFFITLFFINNIGIVNLTEDTHTFTTIKAEAKVTPLINSNNADITTYFKQTRVNYFNEQGTITKVSMPTWISDGANFARSCLKDGLDFLLLDDIKTIYDPRSTGVEVAVAFASLAPPSKALKAMKVSSKLKDSGKSKIVNTYSGLGAIRMSTPRGVLYEGTRDKSWLHIKKRHIDGTVKAPNTTFYPKDLSNKKIISIIKIALKKGKPGKTNASGLTTYKYNFKNKYGIKEMKVVVDNDGIIVSAYPVNGSKVKKVK